MRVQSILDEIISTRNFKSVSDLEYYEPEDAVIVKRKIGYRSTVINISNDTDEELLRKHLASVSAIY